MSYSGSYPQVAGKDIANPLATILSAAMMFEDAFELKKEGKVIRKAVNAALENKILTKDLVKEGDSHKSLKG